MRRYMSRLWMVSGCLFFLAMASPAMTADHESSVETAQPRDRQALDLIRTRCSLCHTPDLIAQQRLERSRWTAVINKMRTWGAQLSDPERDLLLDYLSAQLNPETKKDLSLE